jgi:hypothetical protein
MVILDLNDCLALLFGSYVSGLNKNVGEANSASGDFKLEQKLILFEVVSDEILDA